MLSTLHTNCAILELRLRDGRWKTSRIQTILGRARELDFKSSESNTTSLVVQPLLEYVSQSHGDDLPNDNVEMHYQSPSSLHLHVTLGIRRICSFRRKAMLNHGRY